MTRGADQREERGDLTGGEYLAGRVRVPGWQGESTLLAG